RMGVSGRRGLRGGLPPVSAPARPAGTPLPARGGAGARERGCHVMLRTFARTGPCAEPVPGADRIGHVEPGMPDTITITDNRTGKTVELPILYGTYPDYGAAVRAIDLRQIKANDGDFGLLTY